MGGAGTLLAARRGQLGNSQETSLVGRIFGLRISTGGGLCIGASVGKGRVFGTGVGNTVNLGVSVGAGACAGMGFGVGYETSVGRFFAWLDEVWRRLSREGRK
mmetsp:Transcript_8981/g.26984  ORF Transcript_8981/g.26984 Transcript_8981/m.26984 type:complete len:103 (-) Transcript_8981:1812-2120(-)